MTRYLLIAGAAALALAAPVAAERGGGGKDKGGQAAKVERGGGKAAQGGGRADRQQVRGGGRGSEMRFAQQRGGDRIEQRGRGKAEQRIDGRGNARLAEDRGRGKAAAKIDGRGRGKAEVRVVDMDRGRGRDRVIVADQVKGVRLADWNDIDRWDDVPGRGLIGGCPPGLLPKGCLPPGQAKRLVGTVLPAAYSSSLLPLGLRDIWRDDDDYYYRLGDGYLYRVDRDTNLIASLLPLFGGGLGLGQLFPTSYPTYPIPSYYQPFFADTPDDYYRYSNGYMYEIDRDSGLIENIIPLYDRGYGVGQMLPASYSYYNVPYPYRSMYADSDDYLYRYAPGAIYQVDPTTQLITGIASLLFPGTLGVGQRLPLGYDVYNVPYQYRTQYYDTPDSWYRYGNGYIYQVDPTTRLITAVIDALV